MNARQLLEECFRRFITVKRVGDSIELEALFPEDLPIPEELIEQVRAHKSEILLTLDHDEAADAMLLQSTRRLAEAWPEGCDLDTEAWVDHEEQLNAAYWSGDLDELKSVLEAREHYALRVFRAYRTEVPNV